MTERWKVPDWMAKYTTYLVNTGGTFDDPATAMNCDGHNCNLYVNGPRALLCHGVQSQVSLLMRLHTHGLLR